MQARDCAWYPFCKKKDVVCGRRIKNEYSDLGVDDTGIDERPTNEEFKIEKKKSVQKRGVSGGMLQTNHKMCDIPLIQYCSFPPSFSSLSPFSSFFSSLVCLLLSFFLWACGLALRAIKN